MFKWILDRGKGSKVLCSECTIKKYAQLYIRECWEMKDIGKEYVCDNCRQTKIIGRSDLS